MSFEFVRDLLQESERRGISRGHGGKEPIIFKIKLKKRMKKSGPGQTEPVTGAASSEEQPQVEVDASSTQSPEEEMQPISSQTDPAIELLQEEKSSEIFQGYGGKEPIVFKIRLKKMKKLGPGQTEPVAGAASSEEQPQVEVDASSTQSPEEELQPISSRTDSTPHVKTSVTEEEVEKKEEETQTWSNQSPEEEMKSISSQTDPAIDLLQEEKRSEIFHGYGGKKIPGSPASEEPEPELWIQLHTQHCSTYNTKM
ncbi:unnamed protein product [Pleuronectes platessa]|uniref:Uncharacterized protein n=1 Tax=Pleuronectes platessa TaxID=8262 RepID=A0A9N7YKL9_PLEPL|nr:unnamed protein product [Pleuronectes platessa]